MENPNTNPWYVLMTLYGEQEETSSGREGPRRYNEELHEKNRRAWNAWAGKSMSAHAREELEKSSKVSDEELTGENIDWLVVQERHKSEMIIRNGAFFEYPGIPDHTNGIDLSDLEFEHMLCWQGFCFPTSLLVQRSEFKKGIHAPGAFFALGAYFEDVDFEQCVQLGSSWLLRSEFKNCTFHGAAEFPGVEFRETVIFSEVRFLLETSFYLTKFVTKKPESDFHPIRVKFENLEFKRGAIFAGSTFGDITRFWKVKFYNSAGFHKCKFYFGVHFSESEFQQRAFFDEAEFLLQPSLSSPDYWADSVNFTSIDFGAPTSFERTKFTNAWPNFSGSMLHHETVFTPEEYYWPAPNDEANLVARKTCSKIRWNQSTQGHLEAEHFFFRREMTLQMNTYSGAKRLLFVIYGFFSNFGHSIARPLLSLVILWLLGVAAFAGYFASCCLPFPIEGVERPLGTAVALSFSNLFPLFGFGRSYLDWLELPLVLQVYSALQTVFSFPLLFFLALGLRHQFKLDR